MKSEIKTLNNRMKYLEDQYRIFAQSMKKTEKEVFLETFSDELTNPTNTISLPQVNNSRKILDSFLDDTEFDGEFDS